MLMPAAKDHGEHTCIWTKVRHPLQQRCVTRYSKGVSPATIRGPWEERSERVREVGSWTLSGER